MDKPHPVDGDFDGVAEGTFPECPAVVPDTAPNAAPFAATLDYSPSATQANRRFDHDRIECGAIIADRYELLERIGEGGMGEVWLADQTEPVRRRVAVKLIKPGMDSKLVISRFEAERQALAMMDHPNIARILDGGRTKTGQPFFVMEYVPGVHITMFCDQHRLTVPQRLQLFTQICLALQHAHQKGIIHRDMKPSNVLVNDSEGRVVVKVIDFGLAKPTGQRLTNHSTHTEFGAVVGTLEYMSPEQADLTNQDIDTRSDIYSLGVLLNELLVGVTPLGQSGLRRSSFIDQLRAIREVEAQRPSMRFSASAENLELLSELRQTAPHRLKKQIRGELDWIILKCLEKDRVRRYDSASSLARDIQAHLLGQPVEACPPSVVYALRKYWQRNKGLVLGVMMVLVALVGGIVGTTSAWLEARLQRKTAEDATARTIEANFLRLTQERRQMLESGVKDAVESLRAVGAAFDTFPAMTRQQFAVFAQRILDHHPEIQALEWVPRITANRRDEVESLARREGITNFHFREFGVNGGIRSAEPRAEYFPVLYFEPIERNRAAAGLDLAASAPRRKALQQAVDSGLAVASAPIRLAQDRGEQMGFLMFLPVYQRSCFTIEERRQSLHGFAVVVFRTGDLVERILADLVNQDVSMTIADVDEGGVEVPIYCTPIAQTIEETPTMIRDIEVGGRTWRLRFRALTK